MANEWLDVSDITPRIGYTATASQTVFTVPFVFFESSDLRVYQNEVLLTLDVNYTVTGEEEEAGGTVTLITGAALGDAILISRHVPIEQTTHIPPSGPLDVPAINIQISKLIAISQQIDEKFQRSLRQPDSEGVLDMELPATRQNKMLGFDSDGAPVAVFGPSYVSATDIGAATVSTRDVAAVTIFPVNVTYLTTGGVSAVGDGGAATYKRGTGAGSFTDGGGVSWVRIVGGESLNVKVFGATGNGVTDDTVALQAAIDAAGTNGTVVIPPGIYCYTTLSFDDAVGITVSGSGAIAQSILRCTATTTAGGIKARSTFDVTFSFLHFDHSSASFSGYLVDASHALSGFTGDTQGLYFFRCTFASKGYNLYSAFGVKLDKANLVTFEGCKFVSLLRPIDGQSNVGGSYSNAVRFKNCQSSDNVGYFANNPGQVWTFQDCNFQACHDGAQRIAFSATAVTWTSLTFINCGIYDATAAGSSYLNLGPGYGLNIIGGLWGGASGLGSSTFLNAAGAISGVSVKGAFLSLFTNVFVASAAGQLAWDLSGGNVFSSCTTIISGSSNVTGLSLDLNTPNSSLGTIPNTDGAASIRYNQDGTIEMTGAQASVGTGSTTTITFPTAFPTACFDVQPILQSPASTTNVASLGTISKTGFQIFINGTGISTVRWRAVGK